MTAWEYVEERCASLFALFVESRSHAAARSYGCIRSTSSKMEVLGFASVEFFFSHEVTPADSGPCKRIHRHVSDGATRRNEIAHGMVCRFAKPPGHTQYFLMSGRYNTPKIEPPRPPPKPRRCCPGMCGWTQHGQGPINTGLRRSTLTAIPLTFADWRRSWRVRAFSRTALPSPLISFENMSRIRSAMLRAIYEPTGPSLSIHSAARSIAASQEPLEVALNNDVKFPDHPHDFLYPSIQQSFSLAPLRLQGVGDCLAHPRKTILPLRAGSVGPLSASHSISLTTSGKPSQPSRHRAHLLAPRLGTRGDRLHGSQNATGIQHQLARVVPNRLADRPRISSGILAASLRLRSRAGMRATTSS